MKIIKTQKDLYAFHEHVKAHNLSVGFIPTMGALHQGHISLLNASKAECDLSVVSIFVNPMQFNNKEDLDKYPRKTEEDIELLSKKNCDYLFLPESELIYPPNFKKVDLDITHLNNIMEGEYRPGHFEGVINVVHRFFQLIKPEKAYFGTKDYQQLAIVSYMTKALELPVEIVSCETLREESGLAMSSRNARLSEQERKESAIICAAMVAGKKLTDSHTPSQTAKHILNLLKSSTLTVEYVEIIDPNTLQTLQQKWVPKARVCVAAYSGDVRLIDNLELTS